MRETLRFAREYGASKADQILFGRISAKSGLAIHLTDKVPGGRDGRSAIKYPKFTESDIKANMAYIAGMESVKDIPAEKLQRTGKRPKELFTEYFESLGNSIYSPVFGDISLGKSSIKSEIRHGSTAEKIACIEAIPDVIEKGKVIFFENKIGSDNRVKRIVIAAPIQIAGKPYYMGVMLQRDPSTQYLYLHNVAIEKEMDPSSRAHLVTTGADEQSSHLSMTSILQNAINVKLIGDKILESYSEVLDNLSKSQAISLIQRGITGDDLLNAGDLAAEILSVGGEITEDGKAVLYHGTSKENAEKINSTGKMYGKEDGLFFSTKSDGLVLDYGKAVVKVEIPLEKLILDDIFDSEVHLRMPVKQYQLTDVRFAVEGSGNVAFFDGKNTIYLDANAPRVRSYKGLLGHEVWHKMFKSSRITNLFNSALDKIDPGVRAEVKETYIQHLRELGGFTETEIETVSDEEVAAAYAEELFNNPQRQETKDYLQGAYA